MRLLSVVLVSPLVIACPGEGGVTDSTTDPSTSGQPGPSTGPDDLTGTSTGDTSTGDTSTGDTSIGDTSTAEPSTGDTSTGVMPACRPGASEACYSGPPGTEDVGLCVAGARSCGPEGEWGACIGEVLPARESCADAGDEDCDGVDACAGAYPWSRSFGGVEWDHGRRVVIDPAGSVIVMINASGKGTIDFGGGPRAGLGGRDVSLVKFAPDGAHLWSKRFAVGVADPYIGMDIAVDADGRIALTGTFPGAVDFGGGPLVSQSKQDGFLAVFAPDGAHLWSLAVRTGWSVEPQSVGFDPAGDVILTGRFSSWVDLGGGAMFGAGGDDIFLARHDAAGQHQWSRSFGDVKMQTSHGVVIDAAGDIHIGGNFQGTLDFGGGPLVSAGDLDLFLAKFDAQGDVLWSERFGGPGEDRMFTLAVGGDGRLGFGGESFGGLDLGDGPLDAGIHNYVAVVDAAGAPLWSRLVSPGSTLLQAVAFAGDGSLWMTGGFYEAGNDFGGGAVVSAGLGDIFLVALDAAGQHVSTRSFGDAAHQAPADLAVAASGVVAVTGELMGTVDFGDGPHVVPGTYPQAFVAVFGP